MKDGALKVLFFCNGIFVLAASLLGPLYAVYVEKIGKGVLTISVSWAVFLISATVFTLIISKIGDKIKKDHLLIGGYILRAISWTAYIFINSVPELILLQIFLGLGEALGSPAFEAIFAEHLDDGHHVEEYSDWILIRNIVTAIGTLAGGLIVVSFGFPYLFLLMSFLAIISLIGILLKPKKVVLN